MKGKNDTQWVKPHNQVIPGSSRTKNSHTFLFLAVFSLFQETLQLLKDFRNLGVD